MTTREPSILTGWWDFAVRALALLTTPRADIDACDRAVEQLLRESRVGGAVHQTSVAVERAWASSQVRAGAAAFAATLSGSSPAGGWRVGGWMVAVAGATALGLNQLSPIPIGPLSWIVPTVFIVAGLLVMAAARPLSRAWEHR